MDFYEKPPLNYTGWWGWKLIYQIKDLQQPISTRGRVLALIKEEGENGEDKSAQQS